jgi:flagellar motility protein MotE (MotC chaperone)
MEAGKMDIKRFFVVLGIAALGALLSGAPARGELSSQTVAPKRTVDREDQRRAVELRLKMMESIDAREKELARKEAELRVKEENLKTLEKEFTATIKRLIELEEKVSREEEARLTKLAKVFESAPAEEGGRLLSALDAETAAKVLSRMNARKAGKLWAFVKPAKAKKISEILTKKER